MSAVRIFIAVAWVVFWVYWLISSFGAKSGTRRTRAKIPSGLIVLAVFLLSRVFKTGGLVVQNPILQVFGTILFLSGLALAIWARVYLGRNWGMPMTQKDEPELVTSGPYHLVRHPIYSGILLAMLGTALATTMYWLVAVAVIGAYFIYSARVEERQLSSSFPTTYPGYRSRTKMLLPFIL